MSRWLSFIWTFALKEHRKRIQLSRFNCWKLGQFLFRGSQIIRGSLHCNRSPGGFFVFPPTAAFFRQPFYSSLGLDRPRWPPQRKESSSNPFPGSLEPPGEVWLKSFVQTQTSIRKDSRGSSVCSLTIHSI